AARLTLHQRRRTIVELLTALDLMPVDGGNDVPRANAPRGRRTPILHLAYHDAARRLDSERASQIGSQILHPGAEVAALDGAVADQVTDRAARPVGGNREADPLRAAVDRRVDADQLALDVQQRSPRVARVDRSVGLDEVAKGAPLALERPS